MQQKPIHLGSYSQCSKKTVARLCTINCRAIWWWWLWLWRWQWRLYL